MTDTKELLQKIAALRERLNTSSEPTTPAQDPVRAVAEKVQRGTMHNTLIESSLRAAQASDPAPVAPSLRLTARGMRLLKKGREILQALRKITDDPTYQDAGDADILGTWHHDATALIEVVLRTAQAFPSTVSAQLRLCDGLDVIIAEAEERLVRLTNKLAQRRTTSTQINTLADLLRALALKKPVGLVSLQAIADGILVEARFNAPLRFLSASANDPARFAAAHSLNVAQVLARLIVDDAQWQSQSQLAVMAALVHDVGMTRVPPDILLSQGPLAPEQRRLIEKHTTIAEAMLTNLWPGGGWHVEAARDHHERNDGTGYPLGARDIQISAYAKLLAVCDIYAALCAPRPHRPAFDTRTALTETLLLAEREYLDKTWAERLLLLSFYPVGSAVELSDGCVGLVIATHGERGMTYPAQPIVQVLLDADGKPFAWPQVVDLLVQRERSIVRGLAADERGSTLGKHFPHLS